MEPKPPEVPEPPAPPPEPVDTIFAVHLLNLAGRQKSQAIAEHFNNLLLWLKTVVPEGRAMALMKTKLEEACFYAKAGMSRHAENQAVTPVRVENLIEPATEIAASRGTASAVPTPEVPKP